MPHPCDPASQNTYPVTWFGASERLIGGEPDTRYGWLEHAVGPCIVKAMRADISAYNSSLLEHERTTLRRLAALGAACPELVELGPPDWLVTKFCGLTVHRLLHPAELQGAPPAERCSETELLSAWVHLLRRLQPMADHGVLVADLHTGNVVLPLTLGVAGQLQLCTPVLIDHAHTLYAGLDMRRPLWLRHDTDRIAPEFRSALRQDQEDLIRVFGAAGASLPGSDLRPGENPERSSRLWAEYDAPQSVQAMLDTGELDVGQAMQFAAAAAIRKGLEARTAESPQVAKVLARMSSPDPLTRYTSFRDAADDLAVAMKRVPLMGRHRYARITPRDLSPPRARRPPVRAAAETTTAWASTEHAGRRANALELVEVLSARPTSYPRPATRPAAGAGSDHSYVLYAVTATAAALGAFFELPW